MKPETPETKLERIVKEIGDVPHEISNLVGKNLRDENGMSQISKEMSPGQVRIVNEICTSLEEQLILVKTKLSSIQDQLPEITSLKVRKDLNN